MQGIKAVYDKEPKATIAIIGLGGTGCLVAELLARNNFSLVLVDRDEVEESNLERQILYTAQDIGKLKVDAAKSKLSNPNITTYNFNLDQTNIKDIRADLFVDCTDNMETRFLINDYCKQQSIPWIHTAAIKDQGSVMLIKPKGPCFNCFMQGKQGEVCDDAGVLNSTVTTISSLAVELIIKYLCGKDLPHGLIVYNNMATMKVNINQWSDCPTCNGDYKYLQEKKQLRLFCPAGKYHIFLNKKIDLEEARQKLKTEAQPTENYLYDEEKDITVYNYGRIIIKAPSQEQAQKTFESYFHD
ncbi:HesA/MoeB/ThiF family protein [Candidatus Woesearchaeota archaeon]|nr:HesA/MoeB/ThiF family protein [Candidatus Woesearchaeota archaeon]